MWPLRRKSDDRVDDSQDVAERGTPTSRLGEAEKQILIVMEKLEGDEHTDYLQEALSLVESVRREISDSNDRS